MTKRMILEQLVKKNHGYLLTSLAEKTRFPGHM